MSQGEATEPGGDVEARVRQLVSQGADLYNAGDFWEAHEAWEEAWHMLGDAGREDEADLLQGLILATAAFENLRRGKPGGFAVQGAKALSRLIEHEGRGARLGLADEQGFREALLEAYLDVQRYRIDTLEGLVEHGVEPPELRVQTA